MEKYLKLVIKIFIIVLFMSFFNFSCKKTDSLENMSKEELKIQRQMLKNQIKIKKQIITNLTNQLERL